LPNIAQDITVKDQKTEGAQHPRRKFHCLLE